MKTRTLACALLLGAYGAVDAQDWNTGGNFINTTAQYLGCDAFSTQPLRLKTEANQPIDWYTNAIQRMRLNQNVNYTIGSFPTQNANGYLGLSPDNTLWTNGPGPFSRLHLHGGGTPYQPSYRRWMDNGITFTTDLDQMYIGHKIESGVETAAVIQWGDNDVPPFGPDVLKFIYTDGYSSGLWGSTGLNGLELGRFHPLGRLGLGDFQSVSLQPTERLDLLTGRLRIRTLPTDPEDLTSGKMLVVDDVNPASPEYGVVKWRDINSVLATDCDWEVTGAADVVTAYLGTPPAGCPGESDNVGIGNANPLAKVDVVKSVNSGLGVDIGVNVRMATTSATNIGGNGDVNSANALFNIGWQGNATGGSRNWGLNGNGAANNLDSTVLWTGTRNVGVRGYADGNWSGLAEDIRGVWGIGRRPAPGGAGYGGWFDGFAYCSSGMWLPSDLQLKDQIADLSDATSVLSQLHPKSYYYRSSDFPTMVLDDELQFGLIAQEVEQVLPNLVMNTEQHETFDIDGNVTNAAVQFKSMNYTGLVPWLIAGFNEQRVRIDQLEQDLAACCAPSDADLDPRGSLTVPIAPLGKNSDRLSIAPNPFQEQTTLSYLLEAPARVQLQVNTEKGLHLVTLRDQRQVEGTYSMTWNTQDLAPGVYYVTLFADGVPVVKKAVKVK